MGSSLSRRAFAEFLGTFMLVFIGTGAVVVDAMSGGMVTHVGVALAFGLVVFAMIAAIGDVSGAHLNPAVTLAFCVARRFPSRDALVYFIVQSLGAIAASAVLAWISSQSVHLGETLPAIDPMRVLGIEMLITAMLMFVIFGVTTGAKEKGITAGLAIGGTVAIAALVFGPLTGASMNPARSLGPALVIGDWTHQWIYLVGPVVGALAAVFICRAVHGETCCTPSE